MIRRFALLVVGAVLAAAPAAAAKDPHRWHFVHRTTIPVLYLQGIAAGPTGPLFWSGPVAGIHRTDRDLGHPKDVNVAIPPSVQVQEGYNHIGDLTYDRGRNRLILPMECYNPATQPANFCGHGAFGVADPATLAWRFYVNADVPKAVWAQVSPDGKLVWTSTGDDPGDDVLAFRSADITAANAGPGKRIEPVRRLKHAVPRSGVTGGAIVGHRLYLAGGRREPALEVWSIDLRTGARRLEIQRHIVGESEGLEVTDAFGGALQWIVFPNTPQATYKQTSVLSFLPRTKLRVTVDPDIAAAGRRTRFAVQVTHLVLGHRRPVAGATVGLSGRRAVTNARGRAVLRATLPHRGTFRVRAVWRGDRGSATVTVGARVRSGSGLG